MLASRASLDDTLLQESDVEVVGEPLKGAAAKRQGDPPAHEPDAKRVAMQKQPTLDLVPHDKVDLKKESEPEAKPKYDKYYHKLLG